MRVRALDLDHDWQWGKGRNDYKQNQSAVVQNINTRLSSYLGDCFFAMGEGLDWFNLNGGKSTLAIDLAVSTVILNTAEVLLLINVASRLNAQTRRYTIQYEVETVYGRARGLFTGGDGGGV